MRKMSQEHKQKISEAHKSLGDKHWSKRPDVKEKRTLTLKRNGWKGHWGGKRRENISGANHYLFNPNKDCKTELRNCLKYRQWRCDVYERDNYTCQWCGQIGGSLQADHIKPFSIILKNNQITSYQEGLACEELWNINNGRTLCIPCHKKTDTYLKNIKRT